MEKVLIFTKTTCPFCHKAREILEGLSIEFEETILDGRPQEFEKLKRETGHLTVPQIFINGNFIGGLEDLIEIKNSGQLYRILNKN